MIRKIIYMVLIINLLFIYSNSLLLADNSQVPESIEDEFLSKTEKIVADPFEPYNRVIFGFNDKVYTWALEPTAKGYSKVIPEKPRKWINNFFNNLLFPVRFVNNLLQLKFKRAGVETLRFLINSTIGIAGFGDIATSQFHLKSYNEDFGQTLGFHCMGSIFHIEWPFIGPSNFRDTIGWVGDMFLDPINYLPTNIWVIIGIYTFKKINQTSLHLGEYDKLKKESLDFYTFMRDLYEQNREKLIEE